MRVQHRALQRSSSRVGRPAPSPEAATAPARAAAAAPRHNFADLSILPPGGSVAVQRATRRPGPADRAGLPDRLKSGIEALSGVSMDGVRVRYNSPYPERLGALAYARGREIHLAAGQEAHLPHEAWHLVQQARGRVRPTGLAPGRVALNDDPMLEREADTMGARAASGAAPSSVPEAAPGESPIAMPIQRQTPWWKKLLIGAGIVGGTAAALTGVAIASPALAVGGAAVALGGAYAAHRENEKSKVKLSLTPDQNTMAAMHAEMGRDPNVRFGNGRVDSRYDAQQLLEQYPSAAWQAPLSNMIDVGAGRRPDPPDETGLAGAAGPRRRIDAAFSPPGVFEAKEAETAARRAAARQQVAGFNYQHHDNRRTMRVVNRDSRALRNAADAPAALTNLLARHEGVAFGEGHGDPRTKKFISRHMGTMAASGVNTLYMEHFRHEHQEHLDRFLGGDSMSPELHRYVLNHDRKHNGGKSRLRNVLKAARTHGVRVRAIDSQSAASPDGGGQGGVAIREAAMNHVAHEAITGDAGRNGGKYAILAGAAHNNTQPPTTYGFRQGFERGAPGLSQLLDIPAVQINQGRPVLDKEDRRNRRRLRRNLR